MGTPAFDIKGIFDHDYLYFYADRIGDARSEIDADLVWRLGELAPGMQVLDLACGTGRIANRLARRGCDVKGLDAVPEFINIALTDAAALNVTVDYVLGDMRNLPWSNRFDRVVSWFTAFGYFDDDDNRKILAEVVKVLKPGGMLILDVVHYHEIARQTHSSMVMERDGNLLVDRHRLDPLTGCSVVERTIVRDGKARNTIPWYVRLFTFTELRGWLHDAGFTKVTALDENGGRLTVESPRMVVIAHCD